MASKLDVVKAFFDMANTNSPASNLDAIATYMADDFQSFDKDGNVVMNKELLIGMTQLIFVAFKDLKAVHSNLREEDDGVIVSSHFEGTHTGDFDMSAMGLGVIPASGKRIVWPETTAKWKVEGGKIISEEINTVGMEWFLAPLGVKLPST